MVPLLPGQRAAADSVLPLLRIIGTLALAVIGALLCGILGSVAFPQLLGLGALLGAAVGAGVFACFGCCALGVWRDIFPDDKKLNPLMKIRGALPHGLVAQLGVHGNLDIVLTVHEAVGVDIQGRLPWVSLNTYVEVHCGSNPVKRTCVKQDGKFNEQFKLQVTADDETVMLKVKDQDVFGSTDVGFVAVNVQRDIIDAGFPLRRPFMIEAGENDRLKFGGKQRAHLVLSFDYTDDYPVGLRPEASVRSLGSTRGRHFRDPQKSWQSKQYGAVNFLSKLEFNTSAQLGEDGGLYPGRYV